MRSWARARTSHANMVRIKYTRCHHTVDGGIVRPALRLNPNKRTYTHKAVRATFSTM